MTISTDTLLDRMSTTPRLWNVLRWIVEAGFSGEHAVIARELRPWAGDIRRFLDLGCGTGEFADVFPPGRYVGVDPSTIYLRFARHNRPGSYVASGGESLALAAKSFDAALIVGVLHHLPDDVATGAMAELQRVLKSGATVLVMEDIPPPDPWNIAGHIMHWLDRGSHIRSAAEYRRIFGPDFELTNSYTMRSGICDYAVYILKRH